MKKIIKTQCVRSQNLRWSHTTITFVGVPKLPVPLSVWVRSSVCLSQLCRNTQKHQLSDCFVTLQSYHPIFRRRSKTNEYNIVQPERTF